MSQGKRDVQPIVRGKPVNSILTWILDFHLLGLTGLERTGNVVSKCECHRSCRRAALTQLDVVAGRRVRRWSDIHIGGRITDLYGIDEGVARSVDIERGGPTTELGMS